jgi:hypothetical protein
MLAIMAGGAAAQDEADPAARGELTYTVAVFLFANQTYDDSLAPLEAGFRDMVRQTMALHPQVEVIDPLRLDRAVRRNGYNPHRPIPYREAARIALELEADRAISGMITQRNQQISVEGQMVFLEDTDYQWPAPVALTETVGPVDAGITMAKEFLSRLPVNQELVDPTFLVGSHLTIEIASTAPEVALRLVSAPEDADVIYRGFKIIAGKTLDEVAWDPATRTVFIRTAAGTTSPDWVVELDAVVASPAETLRFALGATPGTTTDLEITNENLLGEPRVAKTFSMGEDTPRSDVLVSGDAVRRDGPVYRLALPFGALEGSLPFHQAAEPAPASDDADEDSGP